MGDKSKRPANIIDNTKALILASEAAKEKLPSITKTVKKSNEQALSTITEQEKLEKRIQEQQE